ncbi:MAG: helix-turn-helix domain-containing protein [Defluviitaleaceae bacterium]|nr:helix-turn-helix domain-containing protein [Defluviitaleaceae bacterium]
MTKTQLRRIIGGNIRAVRRTRGMSIDELAELLELTPGFVGLIERGERGATVHTLYKLGNIMGISIDSFFREGNDTQVRDSNPSEGHKEKSSGKRGKVSSLLADFNDTELDFIIGVIKDMRALIHA